MFGGYNGVEESNNGDQARIDGLVGVDGVNSLRTWQWRLFS